MTDSELLVGISLDSLKQRHETLEKHITRAESSLKGLLCAVRPSDRVGASVKWLLPEGALPPSAPNTQPLPSPKKVIGKRLIMQIIVHKHIAVVFARGGCRDGLPERASLTPRFNDVATITQNAVWSCPAGGAQGGSCDVVAAGTIPALAHLATVKTVKAVRARRGAEIKHPTGWSWQLRNNKKKERKGFVFVVLIPSASAPLFLFCLTTCR